MERNYGVDFLKVFSMLMIITLHIMGHGGIIGAVSNKDTMKIAVVWVLEIFSYCGVNVFALISGFVAWKNVEKTVKVSKLIYLWCSVVFYCLLTTVVFRYLYPDEFTNVNWKECFKPIANNTYWYFTAYAFVFLLSPMLNHIAATLDKVKFTNYVLFIFVVFSLYPTITMKRNSIFLLNEGYSFVWLAALYLTGLYINKYKIYEKTEIKKCIVIMISLYIITILTKVIYYGNDNGIGDIFMSYLSPTFLGISVCWLIISIKMRISNRFGKLYKKLASTTLGVYLIHDNKLVRQYIIKNKFSYIAEMEINEMILRIIIVILCVFIICSCIDKIKDVIFKISHIKELSEKIEKCLRSIFARISGLFVDE